MSRSCFLFLLASLKILRRTKKKVSTNPGNAAPTTDQANLFGLPLRRHNFLCNCTEYLELACDIRDNLHSFAEHYYDQKGIRKGEDSEAVGLVRPLLTSGPVASDETGNTGATGRASFLSDWSDGMADYKDEFMTEIPNMIYANVLENSPPISDVTPPSMEKYDGLWSPNPTQYWLRQNLRNSSFRSTSPSS